MRVLLDTHLILWAAGMPERLSQEARAIVTAPEHELFFSAASLWEVAIKSGLGRSDFRVDGDALRRGLLENDYREIPVSGLHALGVLRLPQLHRDPFDRLLVAQARSEGLVLVTADKSVAAYGGSIRLV